jgi:hypothetical protein
MPTSYFVGVDLGQSRDFTAIAAVERQELSGEWDPAAYTCRKTTALRLRFLERVELGTTYPDVVERVVQVTRSRDLAGRCHLVVDGTGVGRPVVDLLRQAKPGCPIIAAVITSGQRETRIDGYYGIPKRDLMVGLQVLLQQGELQIAAGLKYGPALAEEMAAMEVKVTSAGREQFGAWREGTHDDLVFAVALACWGSKKGGLETVGPVGRSRLPGM